MLMCPPYYSMRIRKDSLVHALNFPLRIMLLLLLLRDDSENIQKRCNFLNISLMSIFF